jgi:hypothetical protein
MTSASGTNTSKELVIYEPTTWDLVYTGEEVNRPSTTVTNPPAWLVQLFSRLQQAEQDAKLLADARRDEDAMEIDIPTYAIITKHLVRMLQNSSGRLPKMRPSTMRSHKSVSI